MNYHRLVISEYVNRKQADAFLLSFRLTLHKSAAPQQVCRGRRKRVTVNCFWQETGRQRERWDGGNKAHTGVCCTDKSLHVPVRKILLKQHWLGVLSRCENRAVIWRLRVVNRRCYLGVQSMSGPCFSLSSQDAIQQRDMRLTWLSVCMPSVSERRS